MTSVLASVREYFQNKEAARTESGRPIGGRDQSPDYKHFPLYKRCPSLSIKVRSSEDVGRLNLSNLNHDVSYEVNQLYKTSAVDINE
jgi:hypothetical protein